ncbi:MAG: hypothetical protein Q2306_01645 [Phytoplasma sp.]|uniref:hypothetical protein n=1 Tax=Phytoplasma sp. TaxID=2155 RepID=UPI002B40F0BF|nr:hypothetical protein [Phytoplasma sp.]WRH06592.1 MAG: hypothetical protein Q2306_01645 [Phytoplasma sp.]
MNFFKKYWIVILIILIFSIVIIIGFFETKKEQESLANHSNELEYNPQPNYLSRPKREIEPLKPKIKITKENFDKIKHYVLSENENEILPLSNLSSQEITAIEKIRNSQKKKLRI